MHPEARVVCDFKYVRVKLSSNDVLVKGVEAYKMALSASVLQTSHIP